MLMLQKAMDWVDTAGNNLCGTMRALTSSKLSTLCNFNGDDIPSR